MPCAIVLRALFITSLVLSPKDCTDPKMKAEELVKSITFNKVANYSTSKKVPVN